ncbi:MAG: outer membrane beta-barrel protein [Methyloligellaceae bacterium]
MKAHLTHSLATGAVALTLMAPFVISTSSYADNEQPKFNAQFFNSSKSGDKAVEEAKQKALQKKQEDAQKEAEIKAAAEKIRLEEEKRAEMQLRREEAAERRRIKEARKQAEQEARRKKLARQKAERDARRQAELAEKKAREAERLAALKAERLEKQNKERARRNAARHEAAAIRTTSVHTKSKKFEAPSPDDHAALHKHYANWVSYYAGGSVSKTSIDGDSGASLGAFAGKNWQKGKYVYGVEGELSLLNGDKTNSDGLHFEADWMLSAKGRAGYLVRPDTLLYATGGIAFANFDIKLDRQNYSETLVGFIIGAGVEHQLDEDWSVRAEYAYTDFGTEKVGNSSFDPDMHAIKVSFSYKF